MDQNGSSFRRHIGCKASFVVLRQQTLGFGHYSRSEYKALTVTACDIYMFLTMHNCKILTELIVTLSFC